MEGKRRVVVTGIGLVTPVGIGKEKFIASLRNGVSGARKITKFATDNLRSKIACEVDFDPTNYWERREAERIDLASQYSLVAAEEAVNDAKITFDPKENDNLGVVMGTGVGSSYITEEQRVVLYEQGPRRVSNRMVLMSMPSAEVARLTEKYKATGLSYSVSSACASGNHAIGLSVKHIRWGDADVVITGGVEVPITELNLAGFGNMFALSRKYNDTPEIASRPFDLERDGFIIGEGSGVLILEELEHALARGARIYGEMVGVGFSSDAHHITAPHPEGRGAAKSMLLSLKDAGISPDDVDYINAHGTSTKLNDIMETKAIKDVFREHAYKLFVSSTKSIHGHAVGAAGSIELAATMLGMEHKFVPPTINYETPDPECDLNYVPNKSLENRIIDIAMSNSFGFGGHNASLAVRRYNK